MCTGDGEVPGFSHGDSCLGAWTAILTSSFIGFFSVSLQQRMIIFKQFNPALLFQPFNILGRCDFLQSTCCRHQQSQQDNPPRSDRHPMAILSGPELWLRVNNQVGEGDSVVSMATGKRDLDGFVIGLMLTFQFTLAHRIIIR